MQSVTHQTALGRDGLLNYITSLLCLQTSAGREGGQTCLLCAYIGHAVSRPRKKQVHGLLHSP